MKATSKTGGRLIASAQDFDETLSQSQQPVMVFWTAPWCGPCRLSVPVVKEIMKQFSKDIATFEICTDDLPEVAANAGVVSIPTIHIYYQNQLVDTLVGCVAKQVLAGSVEKVLEDAGLSSSSEDKQP